MSPPPTNEAAAAPAPTAPADAPEAGRGFRAFHPFTRLDRLLDGIAPGRSPAPDGRPILLSVGEPQRPPPAWVAEEISQAAGLWSRYPPPRGTPDLRTACADWLARRYRLPAGFIDPERNLLPVAGTREGLFFAALAVAPSLEEIAPAPASERPAMLIPNPFYHVYVGAALAAGLEPVFVPASAETGFLPDYAGLPAALLRRAVLCVLCSPSNPQGSVADAAYLERLLGLARRHGFALAADECYAEIYDELAGPPPGALAAAAGLGAGLDNLLVFHSLSKRSSAPGLRCGFAAGDPALIDRLDIALRVGGAGVPLPIAAAATRLWRDEAHVTETRAFYAVNFEIAARVLGNRFGARRPAGGFFLWLEVGDGEAACRELWRTAGIKVLPGAYLGVPDNGGVNPGAGYVRIALVHPPAIVERALQRIADLL